MNVATGSLYKTSSEKFFSAAIQKSQKPHSVWRHHDVSPNRFLAMLPNPRIYDTLKKTYNLILHLYSRMIKII